METSRAIHPGAGNPPAPGTGERNLHENGHAYDSSRIRHASTYSLTTSQEQTNQARNQHTLSHTPILNQLPSHQTTTNQSPTHPIITNHCSTHTTTTNHTPTHQPPGSELGEANMNGSTAQIPSDQTPDSFCQMVLSWRFLMTLIMQMSFVVHTLPRMNIPIALVCMNDPLSTSSTTSQSTPANTSSSENVTNGQNNMTFFTNGTDHEGDVEEDSEPREFNWDSGTRGLILSSLFFTGFLGPILADAMRQYAGNKVTLTLFTGVSALLTFLTPAAARITPYLLIAVRVLQGLTTNSNVPVTTDTLVWWSPQAEKLALGGIAFSGINLSGMFSFFVSGYLCSIPIDNGWPFIFYVLGAMTVLWTLVWMLLTSRKPENHKFVSAKEVQHIITHRQGLEASREGKKVSPPYWTIFTSIPALAYLLLGTCYVFILNSVFSYLPTYFNDVLKIPIETTGVLLAVLSVTRLLGGYCWAGVGNLLINRLQMSVNMSRKVSLFVGLTLPSVPLLGMSAMDEGTKWVAVVVVMGAITFTSVGTSIIMIIPWDMAPMFAGFLAGLAISLSSIASVVGIMVIASLTPTNSPEEWMVVWLMWGGLLLASTLIFLFFGTCSQQSWATPTFTSTTTPTTTPTTVPTVTSNVIAPSASLGGRFKSLTSQPADLGLNSPVSNVRSPDYDYSRENHTHHAGSVSPVGYTNLTGSINLAYPASGVDSMNYGSSVNDAIPANPALPANPTNPIQHTRSIRLDKSPQEAQSTPTHQTGLPLSPTDESLHYRIHPSTHTPSQDYTKRGAGLDNRAFVSDSGQDVRRDGPGSLSVRIEGRRESHGVLQGAARQSVGQNPKGQSSVLEMTRL